MSEVSRLNAFRTAWATGVTHPPMSLGHDGALEQKWERFFFLPLAAGPSRLALAAEIDP